MIYDRFIVITNGASGKQQDAIKRAFEGWAWFHHMPQAWLLMSPSSVSVDAVSAAIRSACPNLQFLAFGLDGGPSMSGFGPLTWMDWFKQSGFATTS